MSRFLRATLSLFRQTVVDPVGLLLDVRLELFVALHVRNLLWLKCGQVDAAVRHNEAERVLLVDVRLACAIGKATEGMNNSRATIKEAMTVKSYRCA